MALGAAIACPGRRVVNLQADGSALYSLQALWSQAREACDVLTIICANSNYAILKVEAARQGVPAAPARVRAGAATALATAPAPASQPQPQPLPQPQPPAPPASAALTSLGRPRIDWVALAAGLGVAGARAETAGALAELLRQGLARRGPFLIEAALP